LREISGSATMTTPGGAGTRYLTHACDILRARLTGFYHRVGTLTLGSGLFVHRYW